MCLNIVIRAFRLFMFPFRSQSLGPYSCHDHGLIIELVDVTCQQLFLLSERLWRRKNIELGNGCDRGRVS